MTTPAPHLVPLDRSHAKQVADLHAEGIATGFLSSLGRGFLTQLYTAIPRCPSGFGFVALDEHENVQGFIACAESTGALYKQALRRRAVQMAFPILRFLVRPSVIKRLFNTLRYPSEVGDQVPPAELLSIVVTPALRGQGAGKALVAAATEEFRKRRIDRYKVAVWDQNERANAFYKSCGFEFALTREHHGLGMNVYVMDLPTAE
jgi:ribosomal protein S18 acetylase RimI-like enzyme